MNGAVLLDPQTGRPERPLTGLVFEERHRNIDFTRSPEELLGLLPAHIAASLRRAGELGAHGPKFSKSGYREVQDPVMDANQSAVTGTVEAAMFAVSPWTAIAAQSLRACEVITICMGGIMTTPASSQGTILVTPRWGTTTGGTTLGASAAVALTASLTNVPWYLEAEFTVRTKGATGSIVGHGTFSCQAVPTTPVVFGGAVATIDTTAALGFFFGVTMGSASDSLTVQRLSLDFAN